MRPISVRLAIVLLGGMVVAACSEDEGMATDSPCELSGITSRDEAGILLGTEDADDWCAEVMVFPNPAAGSTTIRLTLAQSEQVRIAVRSPQDEELRVLVDQTLPAGAHAIGWDLTSGSGARVDSGIYCITVQGETLMCSGDVEVL